MKKAGKTKRVYTPKALNSDFAAKVDKTFRADLTDALDTKKYGKLESYAKVDALHAKAAELAGEDAAAFVHHFGDEGVADFGYYCHSPLLFCYAFSGHDIPNIK